MPDSDKNTDAKTKETISEKNTAKKDESKAETKSAEVKTDKKDESKKATSEKSRKRKKKKKKHLTVGQAHIKCSYNNTIVTITDSIGNVVVWSSSGKVGFKGPKKSTPYAASQVVKDVVERAKEMGLKDVDVFVKGVGSGRDTAIRGLVGNGLNLLSIKDLTPVPHNGCRPKKPRRV